jgi:hypothetical protein
MMVLRCIGGVHYDARAAVKLPQEKFCLISGELRLFRVWILDFSSFICNFAPL